MKGFEWLYCEPHVTDYPDGARIAEQFPPDRIITVDRYTELFHRKRQDFQKQKRRPSLILGVGRSRLLYPASDRIREESGPPAFYSDQLRNCPFNCDYCFLQGMHESGFPLVFVNTAAYLEAAHHQSHICGFRLYVSFLTDAPAFESIIPTVANWTAFAHDHPRVQIDVRTKSDGIALPSPPRHRNVRLTWTVSPPEVTDRYERGTASLEKRLSAMNAASELGFPVSVAVDPVVLFPGWQEAYHRLIDQLATLPPGTVEGASYGVFRMNTRFLDRIQSARGDSPILHYPFTTTGKLASYDAETVDDVRRLVGARLGDLYGAADVSFVHG